MLALRSEVAIGHLATAVLIALAIAVLAVVAGAALGLFGGRDSLLLQPVYAFGVVAALVVVAGHLLPEAAASLGVVAIGIFAVGLAVPAVVERLAARRSAEGVDPPLSVGFLALLLHQFGDGAALGAAVHTDAVVGVGSAIAAHTVPLVTLLMALMIQEIGLARAWLRAGFMAVATVCGIVAVQVIPESVFAVIEPYASALIAGVLLHVILHAPPAALVRPISGRLLELVAIGAGLALALLGNEHESALGVSLVRSFMDLALAASPALLAGLTCAAAIQTLGASLPPTWMRGGPQVLQALRGAVIGVPLPVCTCGVLPTARALLERGAAPALLVAFVVAAPVLGLDTFLVTARLVGLRFALARVLCVVVVAVVGALALTLVTRRKPQGMVIRARVQGPMRRLAGKPSVMVGSVVKPTAARRALDHFDELVFHVVPWTVAGLVLASYLDVLLPAGGVTHPVVDVIVVMAVAVPAYVSASAVTPLAAVLLGKGLSPGAVLAGLVVGPAIDLGTMGFLKRSFGARATAAAVIGVIIAMLIAARGVNAVWSPGAAFVGDGDSLVARVSAVVLIGLAVRSIWQSGIVAWAETLSRTPSLEWRVSRAYARL